MAITVIIMAVILLGFAFQNLFKSKKIDQQPNTEAEQNVSVDKTRHPLNGQILQEPSDFFVIAVMIDNAYDIRPQYGLGKADIIYEALAEGNITRLVAIFDSQRKEDKIGPVRSARNYYMDWAEEYKGVYMHVGGSPQALKVIDDYDFVNIDQIGAGEIYFWRDNNLNAPHNVFTSDSNWLRVGELKDPANIDYDLAWNFVDLPENLENILKPEDFVIDFGSDIYAVDWKFNNKTNTYQRWQGGDKFLYNTGEQATADNIIVQVADSHLIDEERRSIDTQAGGKVFIFNLFGKQEGRWQTVDGRTRFYDENNEEMKLVPGKTWVEVINNEDGLLITE